MARHVRDEIRQADWELSRFCRYQVAEFAKLGYPRDAAFARSIAAGTVGTRPIDDDQVLEAVGSWYWSQLRDIDRRLLSDRALDVGTERERARTIDVSIGTLRSRTNGLLMSLSGWLAGKGFL